VCGFERAKEREYRIYELKKTSQGLPKLDDFDGSKPILQCPVFLFLVQSKIENCASQVDTAQK
jgi:hypothetical protein